MTFYNCSNTTKCICMPLEIQYGNTDHISKVLVTNLVNFFMVTYIYLIEIEKMYTMIVKHFWKVHYNNNNSAKRTESRRSRQNSFKEVHKSN